jgi:hypothetical protein
MDHTQMDHAAMQPAAATSAASAVNLDPKEPGQSAYAAMGEAVRILMADPNTDWSKVDVDTLRRHLVDMDNVTMRAAVATIHIPNGARFIVTGDANVAQSIERMTKSHFAEPDVGSGWTMKTESRADGAAVTVTSADPAQAAKIAGLGFFGILTMGAHHQPHHLMMARAG